MCLLTADYVGRIAHAVYDTMVMSPSKSKNPQHLRELFFAVNEYLFSSEQTKARTQSVMYPRWLKTFNNKAKPHNSDRFLGVQFEFSQADDGITNLKKNVALEDHK